MNSQLSYEMSRCHTQDLMRAAERAQMVAEVKRTRAARPSRRFRWSLRTPRTAPAVASRVRVA